MQHVHLEHLVAGIAGGVTSTLVTHPLDMIKIRFAVCDDRSPTLRYSGLCHAIDTILKKEGVRGFYKGVTPSVWGSGLSWGLYFYTFNVIKSGVHTRNPELALGPSKYMAIATQAGVLTLALTNPVWVVKTRMCVQKGDGNVKSGRSYAGMIDALKSIYRDEGVRGLYRGFVPGIIGISLGAIQFMTYEEMKATYNSSRDYPIDTKLEAKEYLFFAATSKLMSTSVTYPYQVVRARLQDQYHNYKGSMDCIRQTWRYEGFRGFYKGLFPNVLTVIPATVITFLTYEHVWRWVQPYVQ